MKLFLILILFGTTSFAQETDLSQKEADEQSIQEIIKQDTEQTSTSVTIENTPATTLPLAEDKFAGIVQHTEGRPYIVSVKKNYLDFKDLIQYGDTIIVPKKTSKLKIITQKRCIAVLYENTKAVAPKDRLGSWKILQGAARWICPEDKVEIVEYKTGKVEIKNGEILISKNQLIVLKPKIMDGNQELKFESIYNLKKGVWTYSSNQKDPYELYKYEKIFPSPIESSRKNLDRYFYLW